MKLRLLALGAFVICLTGCFDITETFNIKEDGSGVYEMKMDMSRATSMLAMMKQGGKENGKAPEKMDSTFYYKDMVDTVTTLTPEEKTAFKNAYGTVHIDEEEGEMYVNMTFPFKDAKELAIVQKAINKKGNNPLMDVVGKAMKSGAGAPEGMDPMAGGAMGGGKADNKTGLPTSDFVYSLAANSFSRKLNAKPPTQTKAKGKDEEMPAQFKEMMKVNYTTIVNLPRPAKKLSGKGTLSDDKKQVKFTKGMSLDDPQLPADFDFTIDY
jgi:hypothetical protein